MYRGLPMSRHFSENRLYARSARINDRLFALSVMRHTMEQNGQQSTDLDTRINQLTAQRDAILRLIGYLD